MAATGTLRMGASRLRESGQVRAPFGILAAHGRPIAPETAPTSAAAASKAALWHQRLLRRTRTPPFLTTGRPFMRSTPA